MGRTTSGENKSDFITIRVKPSLKEELLRSHKEIFGNVAFQDFLATILSSGLEYEQMLQEKKKEWKKSLVTTRLQKKENKKLGGAMVRPSAAYSSLSQNHRLREVEDPSFNKIAHRRNKKREETP